MTENEIIEMYDKGLSATAISEELDLPLADVKAQLQLEGRIAKTGRPLTTAEMTAEEVATLLSEYTENRTPAVQLIAKYGITWNAFYKLLEEHNVPYREIKHEERVAREVRLERAITMYKGGARIWEIEAETGIRQPVLHNTLHARGIPLRRQAQGRD